MPDEYERLIDNTIACLNRSESDWAKNYWATNLAVLMRKLREKHIQKDEQGNKTYESKIL